MVPTSNLDSALEELALLEKDSRLTCAMKDQIQTLKLELGFLKLFIWSLPKKSVRKYFISSALGKGKQAIYSTGDRALARGKFRHWDLLASKLLQKIEDCKPKIKENCLHLLDYSDQGEFSAPVAILLYLKHLVSQKADITVALERIIGGLEDKLILFTDVLNFSPEGCIFKVHIQAWAHKLACFSLLYWADRMEETMAARMGIVRSDVFQMANLCTPAVIGMYLEVSKVLKSPRSNTLLIAEAVAMFVNFLLNNLIVSMNEHFEVLQERLIFLITFLMNPPEEKHSRKQKHVLEKANAIANEVLPLVCSLSVGRKKKDIVEDSSVLLCDFLEKIETVEREVKKLYVPFPHSSSSNFPRTNILGFIDLHLENMENLKEILKCKADFLGFTKHQFVTIQEKLGSLRPSAEDVLELKEKHEELEGLWMRIINVAYQAELVIDSYQIIDVPIWYNMIRLSYLRGEINSIEAEIKEIRDKQMYSIEVLDDKLNSRSIHHTQANGSRMDEVLVGFEDEAQSVIDQLTLGTTQLEIVSIVGIPGQGKTTLARKVYCDPVVRCHFHKCAWSYVSSVYKSRDLLLQILRDVNEQNAQIYDMSEADLAQCAYRNLKGRRYLIVMDDIWDISAWDVLKESFPNDNNGSRILFTSRNHNMSLLAKSERSPLHLRPPSDEESWKLIQEKLFHKNRCPLKFSEIGKQIAKSCKGLPLAIVVIAGVLAREIDNLDWWKQILPCLDSWLFNEGCMDILELSYKNLPNFLKPCFLYLGAFGNYQEIKVHKLTQLWISEGFIPKVAFKSLEDIAMEYLMDLVGKNLVIVVKRHSSGKIKQCRVHDLLRELCLSKVKEERFFNLLNNPDHSLNMERYEHYRLCISSEWRPMDSLNPISPNIRSVILSGSWHYEFKDEGAEFALAKFKFLKVLDLEDICLGWLSSAIFSLILLRYLAVRCEVKFILPFIANLQSLEFLRLVKKVQDLFSRIPYGK